MNKLKVFISGQKKFGEQVLRLCLSKCEVVGVCCPLNDQYLGRLAATFEVPIMPAGSLNADTMPRVVDLGITAHSFDYIGRKTRYMPKYGWIGYHPSLLPRHRGRSAIEWAIRMKEPITGGTVFWLNSGVDRGDIGYQDWCFIDPGLHQKIPRDAARELWRDQLMDIGLKLFDRAIEDISVGKILRVPQDNRYSTFEPSTDLNDVYRPDLLMLKEGGISTPGRIE
jgi:methionyl-tRNA formyltransferase